PRSRRHHPAHAGRHRRARRRRVRRGPVRRRAHPRAHALPADRDRRELADRGAADDDRRPGPVPVAVGRARDARPLCRRDARRRRLAARQAGRLSGTMGDMGTTGPVTPMIALTRAALQAPFGRRARRELLFCLVGVLVGLAVLAVVVALLVPGTAASVIRAAVVTAVLVPLALATGMARRLGAAHRRLAERLLGERV